MKAAFIITLGLADAAAAAPQAKEQVLLDIDGTLFLTFGLFLFGAFILTQFLWKPYLQVRQERVGRVDGYKDAAKQMDLDAADRIGKVEARLAEARRQGSLERTRVRTQAVETEQKILSSAHAEAQKNLAAARSRLESSMAAEKARMAEQARSLAQGAAEQVLGRSVPA